MPGSLQHTVGAKRPRWIPEPPSISGRAGFPIVAIGASAGGLDACRKLLDALPAVNGMAFIIVQHLDPSHDSMMADLLAGHTSMPVLLATDGMKIDRERVYVIPPGVYLSVDGKGGLRLSKPQARHGARLPFDFLLNSLAREYGARAVCVVLSGTGADGSLGLKAVKESGGLVIAQDIAEADYDGMPRSAIATGAVDLVLRTAKIAEALVAHERGHVFVPERRNRPRKGRSRICCRTSSLFCARRRFTILLSTSTARSSGALSGEWRWRELRPPPGISTFCFVSTAWRQADALQEAGADETIALQPLLNAIDTGEFSADENTVLIVDEISQIGPRPMLKLLELQAKTGMTIKMLGDREQVQSIEAGDTIALLKRVLPKSAMPEVLTAVRQKNDRDRKIAALFRDGKAETALAMKREDGTARLLEGDTDKWCGRSPTSTSSATTRSNPKTRATG